MTDINALVDKYCQGWSDQDPLIRETLIRETLSPNAIYCDPRADHLSVDQLLAHIATVQQHRPGAIIERTSDIDSHHGVARFAWQARLVDGSTLPEGIDFIELDSSGTRLSKIIGFFGPLAKTK